MLRIVLTSLDIPNHNPVTDFLYRSNTVTVLTEQSFTIRKEGDRYTKVTKIGD